MHLYPTRPAAHVAIAAFAVTAVGVVAQEAAIVGWGGAMLLGIALARAATLVSVARIRTAGFEMLWSGPKRMQRVVRGATVELEAEVRNRDTLAARYIRLRAVASSALEVTIEPGAGEVAASGRLRVLVKVKANRVGQHGLHGLALEVHGAPGMFEVPLTFANPYGIEVSPRPFSAYLSQPRGGRSRLTAASGRPGRARGDGSDLRELREHHYGDPFRRIAWKSSARRGQLMVRDFEREERDVVWAVLDASVELWAGPVGRAPLDLAIDEVAAIVVRHMGRGDRVGLAVYGAASRIVIPPDSGPGHVHKILHALTVGCATYDHDRSDLDELDVAVRVLEHLRPLDPRGLADVRRGDLDRLAQRADAMRPRAPFAVPAPSGRTGRERTLRRYLACFGVDSPPRLEADRKVAGDALVATLGQIAHMKPRASLVHIVGLVPATAHLAALGDAARRLSRGGGIVSWSIPDFGPALEPPWSPPPKVDEIDEPPLLPARPSFDASAPQCAEAVLLRARAARLRSERALKKVGIRVFRLAPRTAPERPVVPPDAPDPAVTPA